MWMWPSAPPIPICRPLPQWLQGTAVKLGAQDVHWEENGAYTGKISCGMLKAVGVEYVIIGHSEQRTYFGETDETVNRKVKATSGGRAAAQSCAWAKPWTRTACRSGQTGGRNPNPRGSGRIDRRAGRTLHHRLRAGVGHRHRRDGHPRAGQRRPPDHPGGAGRHVRRRHGPGACAFSTAAA